MGSSNLLSDVRSKIRSLKAELHKYEKIEALLLDTPSAPAKKEVKPDNRTYTRSSLIKNKTIRDAIQKARLSLGRKPFTIKELHARTKKLNEFDVHWHITTTRKVFYDLGQADVIGSKNKSRLWQNSEEFLEEHAEKKEPKEPTKTPPTKTPPRRRTHRRAPGAARRLVWMALNKKPNSTASEINALVEIAGEKITVAHTRTVLNEMVSKRIAAKVPSSTPNPHGGRRIVRYKPLLPSDSRRGETVIRPGIGLEQRGTH